MLVNKGEARRPNHQSKIELAKSRTLLKRNLRELRVETHRVDCRYKDLSTLSKSMILQMRMILRSAMALESLILISSSTKKAIGLVYRFQKPNRIKLSILQIK